MTKLFTDDELTDDNSQVVIPDDEPLKPFLEKYHDQKGVAKAIVEKDDFIKRLQRENAEVRGELASRVKVEEVVDRLSKLAPQAPNPSLETNSGGQPSAQPQPASGISMQDVEKLLEEKAQTERARANLEYSKRELEKAYGADWKRVAQTKMKEMGETQEFFDALAQQKPNVLLALLAQAPQPKPQQPSLFNSSVNTTAASLNSGNSDKRTMAYYKAMKAKDPVRYASPATQNQMHKDALQLREAFFDA